ncbi:hypothetical protein EDB80DRAFT_738500 [Ilyonectria destructans]|nr:hypothetical protein EDB80DRAFT_738500 [Ilyonectria destructans]
MINLRAMVCMMCPIVCKCRGESCLIQPRHLCTWTWRSVPRTRGTMTPEYIPSAPGGQDPQTSSHFVSSTRRTRYSCRSVEDTQSPPAGRNYPPTNAFPARCHDASPYRAQHHLA